MKRTTINYTRTTGVDWNCAHEVRRSPFLPQSLSVAFFAGHLPTALAEQPRLEWPGHLNTFSLSWDLKSS